jgi:hypothetical protein
MNAAKTLRFTAVMIVLAGYVFVFRAGESRIGDQLADNARIAEQIATAERALASAPALETERRRLSSTLVSAHLRGTRGAHVARFMRDAARVLAAHRATIATIAMNASPIAPIPVRGGTAIAPTSAPAVSAATTVNGTTAGSEAAVDQLDSVALDLTVEARYADVLDAVRALSRTDVLASVGVTSLARKNADASEATLTATLHVVLHHLPDVRARPV